MVEYRGRVLADEHAVWIFSLLKETYKTAFIHGYKYGYKDGAEK